jgi:hypothetical protein
MTGDRVAGELTVLAGCFVTGLAAGMLYDVFRLFRLLFRKTRLRDAIFDVVYYAAAGALCALALFELNGGSPRLYALAGFALGALAYRKTAGDALSAIAAGVSGKLREARKHKEEKVK